MGYIVFVIKDQVIQFDGRRRRHHVRLKRRELLTQWHSVIYQKTLTLSNSVVRTLNLTFSQVFP